MNPPCPIRLLFARPWFAAIGAVCVSGCAVQSAPVITTSVGEASATTTELHLIEPDTEQDQRGALYAAVVNSLQANGLELNPNADMIADIAISVSPSPVGIYASEAGQADEEPNALVTARKRRWYDVCEPVRVQATMVLYSRSNGQLRKTSKAESIGCAESELPVAELAGLLVADILSD